MWGVYGGGYLCGVHLWGLAEYAWYVSFRMCSLDRMCSTHTGGSQNTPDMCLLVWGDTYQACSRRVGFVEEDTWYVSLFHLYSWADRARTWFKAGWDLFPPFFFFFLFP